MSSWSPLKMSDMASRTSDPIEEIAAEVVRLPHNPDLAPIKLSIGDPTASGEFLPPANALEEILATMRSNLYNGYDDTAGNVPAREALAEYYKVPGGAGSVFMSHGCTGAMLLCIHALANPGDEVLVPTPGYSIYDVMCTQVGINASYYQCLPEKDWE
eukprot:PhM_4_TR11261/c2_g2_i1/m.12230/K00815/TAT; tyrosine aminotransferase